MREQTHAAIYAALVRADLDAVVPSSFAMFSDEANAAVRDALTAFLADPAVEAMMASATPQERLEAFQDSDVL